MVFSLLFCHFSSYFSISLSLSVLLFPSPSTPHRISVEQIHTKHKTVVNNDPKQMLPFVVNEETKKNVMCEANQIFLFLYHAPFIYQNVNVRVCFVLPMSQIKRTFYRNYAILSCCAN